MRRVARSAALHGTDADAGRREVEALIAAWRAQHLLDDRGFAAARAARLHREGASARMIAAKLAAKGIGRATIAELVSASRGEAEEARPGGDLAAAMVFARKRRLGPFRTGRADPSTRMKDLAAFARAGFDRRTAETVLGGRGEEEVTDAAGSDRHRERSKAIQGKRAGPGSLRRSASRDDETMG